eukprot:15447997-Alexandrium_andersonii.AAC.1
MAYQRGPPPEGLSSPFPPPNEAGGGGCPGLRRPPAGMQQVRAISGRSEPRPGSWACRPAPRSP